MKKFSLAGAAAIRQRERIRKEFWSSEIAWLGPDDMGYFCAPRSLPFVLQALGHKDVSGNMDPGPAYVELLARHIGQGVVDMSHDEDHAAAAGYANAKTWRARMKILEQAGFIRSKSVRGRYTKVFLVHPTLAMRALHADGKVSQELWDAYRTRQIDAREPNADELVEERKPPIGGA